MRVLVLGSSGFLGSNISFYLKKKFKNVFLHTNQFNTNYSYDLTNKNNINNLFNLTSPDVVINCIGLTNVDLCENNKNLCNELNCRLVKNIAEVSDNNKCWFIHISTDHVYNINKLNLEDDVMLTNQYSKSKFNGDEFAVKFNALVLRTNFFGSLIKVSKKASFMDWVIKNYQTKKKINLFNDVIFSPLLADTVSQIITELLNKNFGLQGLFNLGSNSVVSKEQLAKKILFKSLKVKQFQYNSIRANKFLKVIRPNFMQMNSSKFIKETNIYLPTIEDELKKINT